jgi:hypothetical protein
MVDDLDSDPAVRGGIERVALGAVEGRPLGLVDLGPQGALELAVGVVGTQEVAAMPWFSVPIDKRASWHTDAVGSTTSAGFDPRGSAAWTASERGSLRTR